MNGMLILIWILLPLASGFLEKVGETQNPKDISFVKTFLLIVANAFLGVAILFMQVLVDDHRFEVPRNSDMDEVISGALFSFAAFAIALWFPTMLAEKLGRNLHMYLKD